MGKSVGLTNSYPLCMCLFYTIFTWDGCSNGGKLNSQVNAVVYGKTKIISHVTLSLLFLFSRMEYLNGLITPLVIFTCGMKDLEDLPKGHIMRSRKLSKGRMMGVVVSGHL